MSRLLYDEWSTAITLLRAHRWRSLLTVSSVILATALLLIMLGVRSGLLASARQLRQAQPGVIVVQPRPLDGATIFETSRVLGTLTDSDEAVIQKTAEPSQTLTLRRVAAPLTTDDGKHTFTPPTYGATASFPTVLHQTVAFGSFLADDESDTSKAVIGADVAAMIFGQLAPLGQSFELLGHTFIVTGVLAQTEAVMGTDANFNNAVIIGAAQAQSITHDHAPITSIYVSAHDDHAAMIRRLSDALQAARGGQHDVMVSLPGADVPVGTWMLFAIVTSTICVLVGVVSITNILLLSVTERTHEIGLRKAVGATNANIFLQFLIEADVLAVAGAALGTLLGLGALATMRILTDIQPVVEPLYLALIMLGALLVGLLAGLAPAAKAARKLPIAALRNM